MPEELLVEIYRKEPVCGEMIHHTPDHVNHVIKMIQLKHPHCVNKHAYTHYTLKSLNVLKHTSAHKYTSPYI